MVYLRKYLGKNSFFKINLYNLKFALGKEDNSLAQKDVTCIMATKNEEITIKYAIESSMNFVSKYIIVDKDGSTVPKIKEVIEEHNLDADIYIKPDLNLKQSWQYGIERVKDFWVLIQDGDEIFYTEGPSCINNLRKHMIRYDMVLCAPKIMLQGTLKRAHKKFMIMPPHTLLYQNNGTIRISEHPDPYMDHPDMDGWRIGLPNPFLFNCRLKRDKDIERHTIPYNPEKYYPYPSIVERMMVEMDPKYVR